ncbi:TIR domain-containing protein [Pseudomonas hamedanensis]|uniref:TIR domain-containing protein n=1 Tax=Pseudomonas hamedanensis TaxID=2745504 RepID=UPI001CECCFCB|nr:TIR domain-containing protein [Pseudomonas hamedanensis]
MTDGIQDIMDGIDKLEAYREKSNKKLEAARKLKEAAEYVAKSFCGSWMGYHSRIYYLDLQAPPPGEHFDAQWGFQDAYSNKTSGQWREYAFDDVVDTVKGLAGNPDMSAAESFSKKGEELFNEVKRDAELAIRLFSKNGDSYGQTLLNELEKFSPLSEGVFVDLLRPKGARLVGDVLAMSQGTQKPPHVKVFIDAVVLLEPAAAMERLIPFLRKAYSYMHRSAKKDVRSSLVGTNVFIGHGRSHVWRDLKDFVTERLRLPFDEFNRVPVAGITNIARLSEMLDSAAVAFIVMTAEDEQMDGKMEARTNVIHEVGLFQGRLGFTKAIVLLEEGCEEFSNIQGLGQIRFPKGDIRAKFEEIRLVLEREKILES